MPFIHASAAMGKVIAEHHERSSNKPVDDHLLDLAGKYARYEMDGKEFHQQAKGYSAGAVGKALGIPASTVEAARKSHEPPTHVVAHNPAVKAKRGDVVAFEHQSSSSYINGPNQTRTRITIGEVTSATRDGQVKEFRDFEGGAPRKLEHAGLQHAQRYIIPSERIANKTGLEQHVHGRGPLAGSGNYKPFESIEEAHSAIKPFVTRASNAAIMRH